MFLLYGYRRVFFRDRLLFGRESKRVVVVGGEVRLRVYRGRLGEDLDLGRLRGVTRLLGLGFLFCVFVFAGVFLILVLCFGVSSMVF